MTERPRIVIALPDQIESSTLAEWLVAEGFEPVRRGSARSAIDELQARRFDLLIADAHFAWRDGVLAVCRERNRQMPVIVVGTEAPAASHDTVMYIPRPVDRAVLMCTVSMAFLDGRPARRSARKAVNRFQAIVNGVPSHLLDVSNEGLRLELPRERQSAPPPFFNVRVPMVGVAVTVQRMWARPWPGRGRPVTWCGAALTQNRPREERAWRMFVDTLPLSGGSSPTVLQVG